VELVVRGQVTVQIPVDVHVDRDELFQVEARFRGSGSCWPTARCERAAVFLDAGDRVGRPAGTVG
jgi:hypothetical protein